MSQGSYDDTIEFHAGDRKERLASYAIHLGQDQYQRTRPSGACRYAPSEHD